MSVIDDPQVVEPMASEPPPPDEQAKRRVSVSPFLLVALVLLVPALWAGARALSAATAPEAFARWHSTGTISIRDSKPGERYTFGIVFEPLPDVVVQGTRVELSDGSVATASAVSICRRAPGQPKEDVGIGAWDGDVSEFCAEVVPVAGQDLAEQGDGDTLILTAVPLEDGPVHVTGIDFTYDQGGRHTTEHVDYDFRVGMG